jgi:transcriptional regulator with XRE-family HTH domain
MRPTAKPDPIYAATVRRLRLEQGITQEALAYEANLTVSAMARIERGQSIPAWTTVRAIAAALGITLQELARAVEGQQVHQPPAPGGW